jgi:DNA-directed RNA polymerase subunit M/transcription elongation factor TFIIS
MYYIRLSEEDPNSIVYYCRNCGHENKNISLNSVTISKTSFKNTKQKYNSILNKYTKMDPTLPRINTIKCPNHECKSNHGGDAAEAEERDLMEKDASGAQEAKGALAGKASEAVKSVEVPKNNREIIYLRYDDINMNFVYLCATCDTVWNTEQTL